MTFTRGVLHAAAQALAWLTVLAAGALLGYLVGGGSL